MNGFTNDAEFKVNKAALLAQLNHAFDTLNSWDYQDLLMEVLKEIESRIRVYERRTEDKANGN